MIVRNPPVPSPMVYAVRGAPLYAESRCDDPRHPALGSVSMTWYRLGEGLVELVDRVAAPQKLSGAEVFIQKLSLPVFL
jgi:hypothetical protein